MADEPDADEFDEALIAAGRQIVTAALVEDLGEGVDVTSVATVSASSRGQARLVIREAGVVAGLWLVDEVYGQLAQREVAPHDATVQVEILAADGDRVEADTTVATITGPLSTVLTGERTTLNLVGHLSGVATATRAYVEVIAGTGCTVRDTRKTTPGLRLLEKAAVRAGGGMNHRIGLHDAILVKDNHVAAVGSVRAATELALAAGASAPGLIVQIEVDTLDQLNEALAAGAGQVLLDNFTPAQAKVAVARAQQHVERHGGERVVLEASGGITLATVRAYAEAGVDHVSVGAVTHSAPQLDVALDLALDLAGAS